MTDSTGHLPASNRRVARTPNPTDLEYRMTDTTSPQPDLQARIYDSLVAFNAVACWQVLQLAQMRQHLAEHLATDLAAAPVPAPAPTDQAAIRDRIAARLAKEFTTDGATTQGMAVSFEGPDGWPATRMVTPDEAAAAVLAVLPAPADRAAVLREAAAAIQDVIDRDRARFPARSNDRAALGAARQIVLGLIDGPRHMAAKAQQPTDTETPATEEQTVRDHVTALHLIGEQLAGIESWMWEHLADVRDAAKAQQPTDEDVVEAHRLALSFALDLGTGAPWDAIRDRAAELHDGAGAQQQPETEARRSTAPLAAGLPLVQGNCPACKRAGLFLGSGGYTTCSNPDCPEPDAATTVLEQYGAEAQPPHHRWYVETRDGVADQWAPGMRFTKRADAVERYEVLTEHHPTWKDGTPVERRLVRETTTYTVEPAPAAQQPRHAP
jgi:hypothetical protein